MSYYIKRGRAPRGQQDKLQKGVVLLKLVIHFVDFDHGVTASAAHIMVSSPLTQANEYDILESCDRSINTYAKRKLADRNDEGRCVKSQGCTNGIFIILCCITVTMKN